MASITATAIVIACSLSVVHDGDTLRCGKSGPSVRLAGIDAPELRQTCQDAAGEPWQCGVAARDALTNRIAGKAVTCSLSGKDRYGRVIGDCWIDMIDLNAWMVAQGWAVAYDAFSHQYDKQMAAAKAQGRGIWAGTFEMPWDWRRERRN